MNHLARERYRARRSRLRPIVAALVAAITAATLSTTAVLSAQAADVGPGYDLPGVEDNGMTMWLGALENPNDPHWLQWCIEAGKPIPEAQATSITTLTDVKELGQGEFTITITVAGRSVTVIGNAPTTLTATLSGIPLGTHPWTATADSLVNSGTLTVY